MSWHYSQALVAVFSGANCSGGNASAPSNTNPPQDGCSPLGKMTDASNPSLSGMTLELSLESHGADWWMSSLAASRAKTSLPLEKARDLMASEAASGLKCLGSLARFDLDMRSWKTHQFLLLGDLEPFSETWPQWGMMLDGECLELSPPELPTNETESGSWRSPAAREPGVSWERLETRTGEPVGSMCRHYDKHTGRMAQIGLTQQVKARMWGTPRASGGMKDKLRAISSDHDCRSRLEDQVAQMEGAGGSLNPTWVEWLMGWPLGWTDLRPLATDKFHEWRRKHGAD